MKTEISWLNCATLFQDNHFLIKLGFKMSTLFFRFDIFGGGLATPGVHSGAASVQGKLRTFKRASLIICREHCKLA